MIKFLEEERSQVPQVIAPFDLEEVKKGFKEYLKTVDTMLKTAQDLIVNNDKTNVDATVLGTSAMSLHKKIIAQRDATKPYVEAKEFVDKFEGFVTILTDSLYSTSKKKETIVSITKAKIARYAVVLESERRKQQDLANKSNVELQGRLDEEAKKTGTVAPKVPPQIIPKKESTIRTESGAAYTKKRWTFKVNDPEWHIKMVSKIFDIFDSLQKEASPTFTFLTKELEDLKDLIPFLIFNETKLRRAVNDGRRHIGSLGDEGTAIHIYEEVDTSFRTT